MLLRRAKESKRDMCIYCAADEIKRVTRLPVIAHRATMHHCFSEEDADRALSCHAFEYEQTLIEAILKTFLHRPCMSCT